MKSIFKNSIIIAALLFGAASISHAQVKVGNNPGTINAGAALEIESTNKGFLPPRMALTGPNDATTIPSPATGMVVYNTATVGASGNGLIPGLVVNNGTPAPPQWSNVQITSNITGAGLYTLSYTGAADVSKTKIVDGFYEIRVRSESNNLYPLEVRLVNDPVNDHVIRYGRVIHPGSVFGSNTYTFTGGANGNWNTYRILDQPTMPTGNYTISYLAWASPQRTGLYESIVHISAGEFVNWGMTVYK